MTPEEKLNITMLEIQHMRKLQIAYYKCPTEKREEKSRLLSESKAQEKKIDQMIENYFPTQQRLF